MSLVAVLPSIWPEWTDACLASMTSPRLAAFTLLLDNTVENAGVAASWNVGARAVLDSQADWLVIISAAVRFGAPGGADFVEALEEAPAEAWALEAGECPRQRGIGFGWHLIGFRRSTFERVGLFDENFWPAYWEDCDFGHRIRCATPSWQPGPAPLWPKVEIDADLAGFAHGVKLAGIESQPRRLAAYYSEKWGGPPAHEEFCTPFGDPALPLSWWPPQGDPRAVRRPRPERQP